MVVQQIKIENQMTNYLHSQFMKLMVQQCAIYTMNHIQKHGRIFTHNILQGLSKQIKIKIERKNCIYSQVTKG